MKEYFKKYKQVLIMLDNDEAGHKAMLKYKKFYPEIKLIYHCIEGCKDTAEIVRELKPGKSKNYFVPLINKILCQPAQEINYNPKQMKLF